MNVHFHWFTEGSDSTGQASSRPRVRRTESVRGRVRRSAGPRLGLRPGLVIALLWLLLSPANPARAQQADPRIEAWLYHSIAGIHTASANPPTSVRLLDGAGGLRAEGTLGARGADGRWPVEFSPDASIENPRILAQPGDRIEVELDGVVSGYTLPEFSAHADVGSDRVSGQAPAGTVAVASLLHRDPSWFDAPTDYALETQLNLGGAFSFDYSGKADIQPGYFGESAAIDAAGNLIIFQYAAPSVTLADRQAFAVLRADSGQTPILSTRNRIGTELFRSAPAIPLGGALYAVLMLQDGNPDFGVYQPAEGEQVALLLDPEPGAQPVVDEPLPRALGSIDAAVGAVWGLAPAGARLSVQLGSQTRLARADTEGAWQVDFGQPDLALDAEASFLVYPGQALARTAIAGVPLLDLALHGNQLAGSIGGWGLARIEVRDAGGSLLGWTEVDAGQTGQVAAQLQDASGQPAWFSPGDRIIVEPELGRRSEIAVPPLEAAPDEARRALQGIAPANKPLSALAYAREPNIFEATPFDEAFTLLEGRSDGQGSFRLACGAPADCGTRYGILSALLPGARLSLHWMEQPIVGLGISQRIALGRATSGLGVSVTPLGPAGEAGDRLQEVVRPRILESFPSWEIPLADAWPEGIQAGDRLRLRVGETAHEIEVPDFSWQADVAQNTVTGTGPAGRVVVALTLARGASDRPPNAIQTTLIGPLGNWQLRFDGFDLRSGDDLELYLFERSDRFLWWNENAIQGVDPPTATPLPSTVVPTASASGTPIVSPTAVPTAGGQTPAPEGSSLYLPALQRP
jgi:hypothetical protein